MAGSMIKASESFLEDSKNVAVFRRYCSPEDMSKQRQSRVTFMPCFADEWANGKWIEIDKEH